MNKISFKVMFAVLAFVTVGLGSYKMYGSYRAANMSEEELLWAENIEALAKDETPGRGKYTVRDTPITCYIYGYTLSGKKYDSEKKKFYKIKTWDYSLKGYRWICKKSDVKSQECDSQKKNCSDAFGEAPTNHSYYEIKDDEWYIGTTRV